MDKWEEEMKKLLAQPREGAQERRMVLRENAAALARLCPKARMTEESNDVRLYLPMPLTVFNEAFRTRMAALHEAADSVGYAVQKGEMELTFTVA